MGSKAGSALPRITVHNERGDLREDFDKTISHNRSGEFHVTLRTVLTLTRTQWALTSLNDRLCIMLSGMGVAGGSEASSSCCLHPGTSSITRAHRSYKAMPAGREYSQQSTVSAG